MIEYRLMNAGEMEQILDLWVEVYPDTERGNWKREFLSIPGSQEHTYVAVDNGRMLSTVLLWFREMHDSAGIIQRVGNVSHVATHPEARGRGHAKQLLELVIAQMERERCDFSILFTSPEAQPLYEKFFWRTCPLPCWQGQLTSANLPRSTAYAIRSSDQFKEPYPWEVLSDIYMEFNQARPFTVRRDRSLRHRWRSTSNSRIKRQHDFLSVWSWRNCREGKRLELFIARWHKYAAPAFEPRW